MVRGLAVLLACQLAGEAIGHLLPIAVPGPVIGLLILALVLIAAGPAFSDRVGVGRAADSILGSLGVLFVPAGVGVVPLLPLIADHPAAIAGVIVISTTVTMLATVGVYLGVKRWIGGARG